MQIESFQSLPLQAVIPSYLYKQYSDDDDLQAFVDSYNEIAQGYLDWFNQTPLSVYTSPNVSGALLDWVGLGLYGIQRPVLATSSQQTFAGYDEQTYNTIAYNTLVFTSSGTAVLASDDIYKRVLTWNLYKGDGDIFSIQWLKNRISRFIHGANGNDAEVLDSPPSITVANGVFTVSDFAGSNYSALQLAFANGVLSFPFQYSINFISVILVNNGQVLQMTAPVDYPSSPGGLAAGSVWYNGGTVGVVPGATPDPTAPPVYFGVITADELLALGGGNLPTTDPLVLNQLWNDGGVVAISAG